MRPSNGGGCRFCLYFTAVSADVTAFVLGRESSSFTSAIACSGVRLGRLDSGGMLVLLGFLVLGFFSLVFLVSTELMPSPKTGGG